MHSNARIDAKVRVSDTLAVDDDVWSYYANIMVTPVPGIFLYRKSTGSAVWKPMMPKPPITASSGRSISELFLTGQSRSCITHHPCLPVISWMVTRITAVFSSISSG